MANTQYVTRNKLTLEANQQQAKTRKQTLMIGLPFVLLSGILHPFAIFFTGVILFFVVLFHERDKTLIAGATGENITLEALQKLPDDFTLFNQVNIPNEHSRTGYNEADFIIAGRDTLFVIEVKHNNSTITGSEKDNEWQVNKIGRGGTAYSSAMRNPIKQVKNQVWLLRNYLKRKKLKPWVQGVVLFTNHKASVTISGEVTVPVLSIAELCAYIQTYQRQVVSSNTNGSISALVELKKCS